MIGQISLSPSKQIRVDKTGEDEPDYVYYVRLLVSHNTHNDLYLVHLLLFYISNMNDNS